MSDDDAGEDGRDDPTSADSDEPDEEEKKDDFDTSQMDPMLLAARAFAAGHGVLKQSRRACHDF